ncbi:MAG TPA: hypothetical protein VK909_14515, partial [Anaerolineales bacterium]|nr:hypothetical protein [Anaerolineales bacterium]
MLPSASFTNAHTLAKNEFNSIRVRALGTSWIAKILHRDNRPKQFTDTGLVKYQNKHFTGIQNIQVDRIIGTFSREADFDKNFRPLKKHLCDRWIHTLLRLRTDGWQPILIHKVGEYYYVEDGHHRVSVARATGMIFIEAEVWDHSYCQLRQAPCPPHQSRA